jgi:hypothetical protein
VGGTLVLGVIDIAQRAGIYSVDPAWLLLVLGAVVLYFALRRDRDSDSSHSTPVEPLFRSPEPEHGPVWDWADYDAYLRTPEWKALRQAALERDEYRCRLCDHAIPVHLEVHHRRYRATPQDVSLEDVTTLCRWCHGAISELEEFRHVPGNQYRRNDAARR